MDRQKGRSLVGPLVLIALGVFFLLYNFGLIGREVWEEIWRFWPLVLVAAGVEIVFARRFPWATLVIGLGVLAVAGFFSFAPMAFGPVESWRGPEWSEAPEEIAEKLAGARSGRIEIAAGVAELSIDGSAAPGFLIEGTVSPGVGEEVRRSYRIEGGRALFTLESQGVRVFPVPRRRYGRRFWDLRLTREIPLELEIKTGVGVSAIDLSGIKAARIAIHTGVGRTTLTLPARGSIEAEIEGGVGETIVYLPRGLAARIRARQGLGGIEVEGVFRRSGAEYLSPDYDTAENRVDLEIKGGVGRISVREG